MIDTESRVGSYKRSAAWQITHLISGMTDIQAEEYAAQVRFNEARSKFMGEPVNEMLLGLTKKALLAKGVQYDN